MKIDKKQKGWSVPFVMAANIDFEDELADDVDRVKEKMQDISDWYDVVFDAQSFKDPAIDASFKLVLKFYNESYDKLVKLGIETPERKIKKAIPKQKFANQAEFEFIYVGWKPELLQMDKIMAEWARIQTIGGEYAEKWDDDDFSHTGTTKPITDAREKIWGYIKDVFGF